MFFIDRNPILVEVHESGTWSAFALTPIASPRSEYLFKILDKMGGVNETVTPGQYHFNVIKNVASLEPVALYKYE